MKQTGKKIETPDPRFRISIIHLAIGWRYWAYEYDTGFDKEIGLEENGYASIPEAQEAIRALLTREARS